jgi:hypothetical protein
MSNTPNPEPLIQFYRHARTTCIEKGYASEIDIVNGRHFGTSTAEDFLGQYVWVVLNSGMKNQVAERIYERFKLKRDLETIRHVGKRSAIKTALQNYQKWFNALLYADNKLSFLETLPWIGPITKYHLARNLGLDVAKPDRHLVRLANRFGFKDVPSSESKYR